MNKMELQLQSFELRLRQEKMELRRKAIETVQINLGRLCNQACLHCHVEAGPNRTEIMDRRTAELAIEFVAATGATTADLTGGAPELNPNFRYLVEALTGLGKQVIVRSNLTVLLEPGLQDLPETFAAKQVEIVASLPCYTQENVDGQRGAGVYQKSMAVLRQLNGLGYGREGSGLVLNLVYNPGGAALPGEQAGLEADYKRELMERFGLVFNHLYVITNQPIGRFSRQLSQNGEKGQYSKLLAGAFNPATLSQLMCLRQVSISWDGCIFDCDFNQMLGMCLGNGHAYRLGEIPADELVLRLQGGAIKTGPHCFACTAGAGSSCGGALA
jgi:radical SAM/Cys-rich protein